MEAKDNRLRFDHKGVKEHFENISREYWTQQGRADVVKWIEQNTTVNILGTEDYCKEWQAKLKDWGIAPKEG